MSALAMVLTVLAGLAAAGAASWLVLALTPDDGDQWWEEEL